eukprot:15420678-Alexandrium_andersonii.AAC.1
MTTETETEPTEPTEPSTSLRTGHLMYRFRPRVRWGCRCYDPRPKGSKNTGATALNNSLANID